MPAQWQLEKVFEVSKRLLRWSRQEEQFQHEKETRLQLKTVNERPQSNNKFSQDTDFEHI